jgi:hypothetical protein
MLCRHCGDLLPADAPPSVTSCTSYANWRARQAGDMLQADEAAMRTVFKGLCALDVARRDGLEMLAELDGHRAPSRNIFPHRKTRENPNYEEKARALLLNNQNCTKTFLT